MNYNFLFLGLLVVVFYFFLLRPQIREKKEFEKLLAALKKGDRVLTNSGIYGEIAALKSETIITVKVSENVKIDFAKNSISKVLKEDKPIVS